MLGFSSKRNHWTTLTLSTSLVALGLSLAVAPSSLGSNQTDHKGNTLFGRSGLRVYALKQQEPADQLTFSAAPNQNKPTNELPLDKLNRKVWANNTVFYLPKHIADITVSYSGNELTGYKINSTAFKLTPVPDENLAFRADYRNLLGLVTDVTHCKLEVNANGILTSANGEAKDQTAPIIADVVASSIKIAKAAAKYAIAAVEPARTESTKNRLVDLEKSSFTQVVTPGWKDCNYWRDLSSEFPMLGLKLWINKPIVNPCSSDLLGNQYINGIVVRSPEVVHFGIVQNDSITVYEGYSQLAQTGTLGVIPIRKHFLRATSQNVVLNEAGAISSLEETGTSSLKTISDALKTIADAL
ncbi:MAG: hypothetical protein JSS83_22200 [Cyanobacteria bacterium SZAS LIN-3]|nr:hypothetical protein [Cyanobacteria bacterium SZAS LIN-3]MBS2005748.1 hypothetical protein [Cyanobacteria bacterium SZAS TMP-1]